jgi:hypothetical protein
MRLELAKATLIGILHRWALLLRQVMVNSLLLPKRIVSVLSSPLQRRKKHYNQVVNRSFQNLIVTDD